MNILDSKWKMVLHTQFFMVRVCRNVQHVFDPIRTVWNLEFVPISPVVLESAAPVKTKSEDLLVETTLNIQVFNHEAGVDQAQTDLVDAGPDPIFDGGLWTKASGFPSASWMRKNCEPSALFSMGPGTNLRASK